LTLFGELYGHGVQKGMHYSTQLHFVCFDILVDEVFVSYVDMEEACRGCDIPYAEALGVGPLRLMTTKFDLERLVSTYPAKHAAVIPGKPPLIAEGIVLRPYFLPFKLGSADGATATEDRPIIKLKREAFSERSAKGVAQIAAQEENAALVASLEFITEARLANVRSKLVNDALPHIIALALAADAMEEIKQESFWQELATDGARKKIQKTVAQAAFALVKKPI
jgi:Rnl2 family RNA ligase